MDIIGEKSYHHEACQMPEKVQEKHFHWSYYEEDKKVLSFPIHFIWRSHLIIVL